MAPFGAVAATMLRLTGVPPFTLDAGNVLSIFGKIWSLSASRNERLTQSSTSDDTSIDSRGIIDIELNFFRLVRMLNE